MIDVSRYYTGDIGSDTCIIVEALDKRGNSRQPSETIQIDDNETIQLIKELFKVLSDKDQSGIAEMFAEWLRKPQMEARDRRAERIRREIDMITADMRTDAESQREYSIGALAALLWVASEGEMMRPMCFQAACETWDNMRRAPA